VQARTLRWPDGHDFYRRATLPPEHVRFCLARSDKRAHCQELGVEPAYPAEPPATS
jgi:hypothetical protein